MKKIILIALLSSLYGTLTACASSSTGSGYVVTSGEEEVRSGTVVQITSVTIPGTQHLGVGAIVGGVAGGALGSVFGKGTGKGIMTTVGALGGAYAGSVIQQHEDTIQGYSITVKTKNGVTVSINQADNLGLRVGDSVVIEGSGTDARVVRAN